MIAAHEHRASPAEALEALELLARVELLAHDCEVVIGLVDPLDCDSPPPDSLVPDSLPLDSASLDSASLDPVAEPLDSEPLELASEPLASSVDDSSAAAFSPLDCVVVVDVEPPEVVVVRALEEADSAGSWPEAS